MQWMFFLTVALFCAVTSALIVLSWEMRKHHRFTRVPRPRMMTATQHSIELAPKLEEFHYRYIPFLRVLIFAGAIGSSVMLGDYVAPDYSNHIPVLALGLGLLTAAPLLLLRNQIGYLPRQLGDPKGLYPWPHSRPWSHFVRAMHGIMPNAADAMVALPYWKHEPDPVDIAMERTKDWQAQWQLERDLGIARKLSRASWCFLGTVWIIGVSLFAYYAQRYSTFLDILLAQQIAPIVCALFLVKDTSEAFARDHELDEFESSNSPLIESYRQRYRSVGKVYAALFCAVCVLLIGVSVSLSYLYPPESVLLGNTISKAPMSAVALLTIACGWPILLLVRRYTTILHSRHNTVVHATMRGVRSNIGTKVGSLASWWQKGESQALPKNPIRTIEKYMLSSGARQEDTLTLIEFIKELDGHQVKSFELVNWVAEHIQQKTQSEICQLVTLGSNLVHQANQGHFSEGLNWLLKELGVSAYEKQK